MLRRALGLSLLFPLLGGAIVLACGDDSKYVYTARKYNATGACLEPYSAIERVNGDAVSAKCAPLCFRYNDALFTSQICPPLPDLAVALDAEAPECKVANGLYDHTCGADAAPAADDDDDDDDIDAAVPLDASDGGG